MASETSPRAGRALVGLLLLTAGCSPAKKTPPPQEEVQALLQQIAETERREAEADVNPNLGVKVTWQIDSVEVQPQPGNEAAPYKGTVRFIVESQTPELDGVVTERVQSEYEYLWDLESGAWVLQ